MKKVILGLLLVALLPVLVACAGASREAIPVPALAPMLEPSTQREDMAYDEGMLPSVAGERMIVRDGDISLVVDGVVEARDEIAQLAARFDGYVVSSQISGEEEEMRGWISIRVSDDRFEPALAELRKLAMRVKSERTSSRDITEEYVDLQSRLKNAEATEQQYLALLEKAVKVEDVLSIYDSLSRVRNEIELLKGRMQYLERTSSMSLIAVQLEPATTESLVPIGWSIVEVFKTVIRGVVLLGQWLGTITIWLAVLSPLWGTILGIILWRRRRREKAVS